MNFIFGLNVQKNYGMNCCCMQQRSAQPRARIRSTRSGVDMTSVRVPSDTSTRDPDWSKKQQLVTGPIVTYNIFCLLPIDKRLAANYVYELLLAFDFCLIFYTYCPVKTQRL